MIQVIYVISLGVAAGIMAGLFGIGGGIILVPILIYAFGYSQQAASGTSLVALLLPVGFFGVYEYYKAGKISSEHVKIGLIIAVGMFLGTYIGARMAVGLSPAILRRSFAVFIALVGVKLWFSV
jgi:uncharacterized membrane protein YfcA